MTCELEGLVGDFEGPCILEFDGSLCDFGEEVGWGGDGDGSQVDELIEENGPPGRLFVRGRAQEIDMSGGDMNVQIMS